MSIRELLENDNASWKNLYVNTIDANAVANDNYVLNAGNPNEYVRTNGTKELVTTSTLNGPDITGDISLSTGTASQYVKTDGSKKLVTTASIPTTDVSGLDTSYLKIDLSNAPVLVPGVAQQITVNKTLSQLGMKFLTYLGCTAIFQEDTGTGAILLLGIGAGTNNGINLDISNDSRVRIGPNSTRRMLEFGTSGAGNIHQCYAIGQTSATNLNEQVKASTDTFSWSHGLTSSTSQLRMLLSNNTLQFNGGGYTISDPDGGLTFGTDNTTVNNHVVIPSQSNTMMICNATGIPVIAATARLFTANATTSFTTGFNNIPGQYSCRYNAFKSRTFQVTIQLSFTHTVATTNLTIFASKNGALLSSNASAQCTYGALGSISHVCFNEQITLNNTDTIQIGVLSSNSGTLTAVFSSIQCTALLTI